MNWIFSSTSAPMMVWYGLPLERNVKTYVLQVDPCQLLLSICTKPSRTEIFRSNYAKTMPADIPDHHIAMPSQITISNPQNKWTYVLRGTDFDYQRHSLFAKWQTLQIYVILLKLNTVRHGLMSFPPCLKQWSALCVWIHCLYSARIAITEACHVASEIYLYSLNNIRNRIST